MSLSPKPVNVNQLVITKSVDVRETSRTAIEQQFPQLKTAVSAETKSKVANTMLNRKA